ncbi:MAG: PD-(D/E)XK nuclease family protein [Firmicutes bacterium]|nr:PD-(D/E)XK nuclease family protein [Bacillota bacterium]
MLNIFTARASSDLPALMLDRIGEDLENIRNGKSAAKQIVLIVPAQFTLQAEEAAFRRFDAKGFFDFHIMSGARLNQQILKETGFPKTTPINTLGRVMLLRRIASQHKEEMQAFGKVCTGTEFLKMAGDFIVQMKQNQLEPSDLESIRQKAEEGSLLEKKLSDMQLLAEGYDAVMAGKFNDSEDMLRFVTQSMGGSSFVKNSIFWYYGFYSFTERELAFMQELMRCSRGVNVCFTMGKSGDPDSDVFAAPGRAARRLKDKAEELGQKVQILQADSAYAKRLPAEFAHLEKNLFAMPPEKQEEDPARITLVRCSNPFTQAETIAAEILSLVRDKGLKYDEIVILTEDMAGFGSQIRRVCRQMGVPLFADEKRAVVHSPAVETAAALLRFAAGGRRAPGMLACLKPGFVPVPALAQREDLERFENYCKQYHIRDDRFFKPFRYGINVYGEEGMAKLEEIRSQIAELFSPFLASMEEAKTVREKSEVFARFLAETLHMPQQLEESALQLAQQQLLDAAEEQQQIWGVLCSLLDQCVELLGDDEISTAEYAELLNDSFADIKVGLLPQAQGSVLLGTLSRSLTGNCRALFLAGVNDGVLPKDSTSEAILTQRELEELQEKGYTLSKTDSVLREENLLSIYSAFTLPSEVLWLGWCAADSEGKENNPSSLVHQMQVMFPQLPEAQDIENADEPLAFIQGKKAALGRIASAMRGSLAEGREPLALWKEVYDQLGGVNALKAGLLFTNEEAPLSADEARALYASGDYSLSPSRLEGFAHCPFRHFVNYGLRPQELKEFEISPLELGNAHHDCLMQLAEWLSEPSRENGFAITDPQSRWMTVTKEELQEKTEEILQRVQKEQNEGVMNAGPKESYQASRIADVCVRFAWMMVLQVRKGRISEMSFETEFRRHEALPPIRIETPQGTVYLEGKIDRVDMLTDGGKKYAKVIDYKSGNNRFDRKLAESGLMLQLGIYLEAALGKGDTKPAGIFYYHIEEPSIASEAENLAADEISEQVWAKLQSKYRMQGFFVDTPAVTQSIDSELQPGERSSVFNYALKNDGTQNSKGSGGTTEEDFEAFRAAFRQSLSDLCERLTSGEIGIEPRKLKGSRTACTFCDYKGICSFDTAFAGNQYH